MGHKIAFICLSMSDHWGGPPKVVKDLTQTLESYGHTIQIVSSCTPQDNFSEPLKNSQLIQEISSIGRLWKGLSFKIIIVLFRVIKQSDIVHIHELWHFPGLAAAILSWALKKPLFISTHGEMGDGYFNEKPLKKLIFFYGFQRMIMRVSKQVFCLNKTEVEIIKSLDAKISTQIIGNGILMPDIQAIRSLKKIRQKPYLIFLGRLHYTKGIDLLLPAFAQILDSHPELELVIAGPNCGEENMLKNLAASLGIKNTTKFIGPVFGNEKQSLIYNAELLIAPSRYEGFGMVILEALTLGTHVVQTSACGVIDIEGLAMSTADITPNSIAENILKKLKGPRERDLAIDFVRKNYEIKSITNLYLKAYEKH